MLSHFFSTTLEGLEAHFVRVEVDLAPGLPGFHLVGLPDTSVVESVHRVRSALRAAGHPLPPRRCTVNLAPGDLRKEGPRFDLAIALGVLAAAEVLPSQSLEKTVVLGELSLNGSVRPVRGVLNTALAMLKRGMKRLILARENYEAVHQVEGLELVVVSSLEEALGYLRGEFGRPDLPDLRHSARRLEVPTLTLDQVCGQPLGCRALEVAAAGGHHLLWLGPPGCGKTMLSQCLVGLLPDLSQAQAMEVAAVRSALGLACLPSPRPPWAQPHCRISATALLGGVMPGEISRAHRGVLFLDEVTEFSRDCLEGLRTALECGTVEVGRARYRWRYPARFQLLAACNPCPCGYFGDPHRPCRCAPPRRNQYLGKLSGPVRDRLDLHVQLQRPLPSEAWSSPTEGAQQAARGRVLEARERQRRRGVLNCHLDRERLQLPGQVSLAAWDFLYDYASRWHLSVRSMERLIRVARTLADLAQRQEVITEDLAEAVHYRMLDRWNQASSLSA